MVDKDLRGVQLLRDKYGTPYYCVYDYGPKKVKINYLVGSLVIVY